ncbi:MAG TPA: 2-C-methyl-D-erythritol 4-phosphate cytidylyltransferase [Paludibacter sp.]|nr:2-C-methyl-D-erythritol 4-phosphate cytidylyltransferase [Paludibacter sp.]
MIKPRIALIVAGGKGERMNAEIPKQFLEIQGKPILMHTIEAFYRFDSHIQLILVLPAVQLKSWDMLCKKHAFSISHQIVTGGQTRFHSVKNGLEQVKGPSLVAVHDGVRPLVSTETIKRCFEAAEKFDAVVPVVDSVDSIRQITNNGSISVDRSFYKLVQTPQVFDAGLLKSAYEQEFSKLFTDDASVVEAFGKQIHLVEGNRENIKITTEIDLKMAEFFKSKMKK